MHEIQAVLLFIQNLLLRKDKFINTCEEREGINRLKTSGKSRTKNKGIYEIIFAIRIEGAHTALIISTVRLRPSEKEGFVSYSEIKHSKYVLFSLFGVLLIILD